MFVAGDIEMERVGDVLFLKYYWQEGLFGREWGMYYF
jgi:hypothetical protein